MSVINTNISALQSQNSLRTNSLNLSTSMERLSTGTRINSAKDDAAGLAISTRMTASIRGISAAIRNANDGISLAQTAEGSLSQISDNLQRVRELAVQSANTGNNASDRAAMNNEAKQLVAEIDRVASNTGFNGIKLLDGSFQNQALQVGAGNDANDRIAVSISSAKSSALGVGSGSSFKATTVGAAVGATALAAGALNINGFSTGAAQADGVSNTASSTSGIAVAATINAISAQTNVTASVGATSLAGAGATGFSTAIAAGDVQINGVSIGPIEAASSAVGRGGQVAAAINAVTAQTGVTATFDTSTGAVALAAADGRNVTVTALNAGGSTAVTGLGSGTSATMAGTTSTSTVSLAAGALTVNGVDIGAVNGTSPAATTTQGADVLAGPSAVNTTPGETGTTNQVDTVTFLAMGAGQAVTVGGLTFTASSALTANDVAKAFGSLTTAQTASSRQGTTGYDAATIKGTYTGTFIAAATAAVTSGTTAVLTYTAQATSSTPVSTAGSAATSETTSIAFTSLAAGTSATVNGLTFTATDALTATQVGEAFASLTSGNTAAVATSTNTASAALGTYSGTFTAGYSTAANAIGTVVATATAAGSVTDIAVNTKFDNLATAINAVSSQTGVTAVNTSGSIALAATAGRLELTGNTPLETGISGTVVAGTASNATTSRSLVTLSTTDSAGINVSGSTAAALTAAGLSEGSATVTTTAGAGVSSIDLTTAAGSQAALTTLDAAINTITDSRAAMGAYQNRLTASISNLESTSMNLSASRSRILDTDYAKETTSLAKAQIISQAATAMLAQANQSGQSVLALLK
jgi:flagellin